MLLSLENELISMLPQSKIKTIHIIGKQSLFDPNQKIDNTNLIDQSDWLSYLDHRKWIIDLIDKPIFAV